MSFEVVVDINSLKVGEEVYLIERGLMKGRFEVVSTTGGRTKNHAFLKGRYNVFEAYVPFNLYRRVSDMKRLTELHGKDMALYISEKHPAAVPLLLEGWTVESAMRHIEGVCDHEICTGDHDE